MANIWDIIQAWGIINVPTQQAIVLSSARDGKYFCFCASDPHSAVLDKPTDQNKIIMTD